uniref:Deoxyguanosinetriphosphate triphosphohydrolase-like protein n=1 Tax=Geobacter sp. (strain M21) TaxID=443144 RepID=C6E4Y4_GEOSM
MSIYSKETIDYAQELAREIGQYDLRFYRSAVDEEERARNDYQRDYARVLYSSSFRRLQGKMQLLGIDDAHFHRNRLTHSLEVAQIARTIAASLGIPDHIVAETCSLAHDLGNPPFGHQGEVILNELANPIGGYEGNAQTFRILNFLEKKSHTYRGLNLTFRTLMGVVKYFYNKESNSKKFLYDDDFALLDQVCSALGLKYRRTIDMQIMDLADEIAYAAHDLDDALSFNMLSIDELIYEFKINKEYSDAFEVLKEIVKECQSFGFSSKELSTSEEYTFLFRKELTSKIVSKLINDIHVSDQNTNKELSLCFNKYEGLAVGLKKLLFKAILRKTSVQIYEKKGEKVIRGLFQVYSDPTFNKGQILLPPEYRQGKSERQKSRYVIDYIAGMMDSFAMHEYVKYFGHNSLERIYRDV